MLRTKAGRSSALRLLDDRDLNEVLALCDRDPVVNVFVSSRVREAGLEFARLGGQVWGYQPGGQLTSLCYAGANLVPVSATPDAVAAFAYRARLMGRRCYFSAEKARRELGWKSTVGYEEGVKKTIAWLREQESSNNR